MAVTAKNASKCKNHWHQPSLQTSIDTLVPVADLISPNLRSSGFPGKPGQEFSPKIAYFWRSKMFLQDCIVGLGYKNTASHVCMIENFKFNHVFCNNFCNNWAKIRQCAFVRWSVTELFFPNPIWGSFLQQAYFNRTFSSVGKAISTGLGKFMSSNFGT